MNRQETDLLASTSKWLYGKNFKGLFHMGINIICTKKKFMTCLHDIDPTGKSNSKKESYNLS